MPRLDLKRSVLAALIVAAGAAGATRATATCVPYPANQPQSTFPSLVGKLLYHSYVSYGDGTSQIFLLNFATKSLSQISQPSWGVTDPMNAMFSNDGNWIVFTAVKNNAWNIFMYRLGSSQAPYNLTNSTGATRNEDPKFSLDGTKLVFKQNKDVMIAPILYSGGVPSLGTIQNLTQTAPAVESSMPFLSPDATTVYFTTGTSANLAIHAKATAGGAATVFNATAGLASYYPIVRSDGTVFFAKWKDASSKLDQIYTIAPPSGTPTQLPLNDCNSNNSDAWPVAGTNYVFFSSTTAGGYQLYLGDAGTGNRWTLTPYGVNANTSQAKLGSSYR